MLNFPELRQTFNYDCGACAGCSILALLRHRPPRRALHGPGRHDESRHAHRGHGPRLRALWPLDAVRAFDVAAGPAPRSTAASRCSLTLQAYRSSPKPYGRLWGDGHYVVAIGHDPARIYFEDPSSYKRTWLADGELLERWHDVDAGGKRLLHWGWHRSWPARLPPQRRRPHGLSRARQPIAEIGHSSGGKNRSTNAFRKRRTAAITSELLRNEDKHGAVLVDRRLVHPELAIHVEAFAVG